MAEQQNEKELTSAKTNKEMPRREFLKGITLLGGTALLSSFLAACGLRGAKPTPEPSPPTTIIGADSVLMNGKVITVDAQDTIAQAVAVKDGKFAKIGSNDDIKNLIGGRTNVIDLKGKTATPGLVDSHIHVQYYGKQNWEGFVDVRPPNVRSKEDLLRVVAERAAEIPKGEWVSGNQGFLLSMEDSPGRWELDSVAPNHPVYLKHMSGQYGVVNSRALELAGINKDTPNPYGGVIVKDPSTGEPTGFLNHYIAQNLVGRIAAGWGERTDEELMADVKRGQQLCLAAGYTSGQDVIVSSSRDVSAYKKVAEAHGLKMRMYLMQYVHSAPVAKKEIKTAEHFKMEMLTFGGWKLAMDGGVAAGTSLMYDTSLPMAKSSYLYHKQETVNAMVSRFHREGYQVSFHCSGDRAIDMAINAIEAALKETPNANHRHKIEHLLFPTTQAMKRIKELGILVSTQPQWISMFADGYRNMSDEKTMERFMPLRTLMEMGIPVSFGCDVPATPFVEPKWTFAGAVTRTTRGGTYTPQQCISMKDVLRMHTMGSAYASFEEDIKGSIEEGKLADMVVWSHDLYAMSMNQLKDLRACCTNPFYELSNMVR